MLNGAAIGSVEKVPLAMTSSRTPAATQRLRATLAIAAFVCVSGLVTFRTVTRGDLSGQSRALGVGLSDFRDAVYYPVVAFLNGDNPYDANRFVQAYPVGNAFPLYLPSALVGHLPFGLVSFPTAGYAYFLVTLALMPALAYLTLRLCDLHPQVPSIAGLAALMLLSRPGYWNVFLGQYAATVAVATYAALYFARTRPGAAALGVAIASMKPTFGVPLALLMLAHRHVRPVIVGALLSAGASAFALVVVMRRTTVASFFASIAGSFASLGMDPQANAATSAYRVDVVALLSRFFGQPLGSTAEFALFTATIAVSAIGLSRLTRRDVRGARELATGLICLAVLTCTYHQAYDLLLLAVPLTALATGRWAPEPWAHSGWRWLLFAILMVPAFNYVASEMVFTRVATGGAWWLAIASLNGATLLTALFLYIAVALRAGR